VHRGFEGTWQRDIFKLKTGLLLLLMSDKQTPAAPRPGATQQHPAMTAAMPRRAKSIKRKSTRSLASTTSSGTMYHAAACMQA
jgi:hypothetical protein